MPSNNNLLLANFVRETQRPRHVPWPFYALDNRSPSERKPMVNRGLGHRTRHSYQSTAVHPVKHHPISLPVTVRAIPLQAQDAPLCVRRGKAFLKRSCLKCPPASQKASLGKSWYNSPDLEITGGRAIVPSKPAPASSSLAPDTPVRQSSLNQHRRVATV